MARCFLIIGGLFLISSMYQYVNCQVLMSLAEQDRFVTGLEPESSIQNITYSPGRRRRQSPKEATIIVPEPAICKPMPEVVQLKSSKDSSLYYFPSCTRVDRCGGCCPNSDLLSCQPSEVEVVNYSVSVRKYLGGNSLTQLPNEIVPVEKHLKCKCDCIIKPKDCNAYQTYNKGSCQCVCTNRDEQKKCSQDDSGKKLWNPRTCSCDCLPSAVTDCSTGYIFNKYTCSCENERRTVVQWTGIYNVDTKQPVRRNEYRNN